MLAKGVIRGKKLQIKMDHDSVLVRFVCVYLFCNALNAYLKVGFGISETLYAPMQMILTMFIFVFELQAMLVIYHRRLLLFLCSELVAVVAYLYSWLRYAPLDQLLNYVVTTCGVCIPLGVAVACIQDYNLFLKQLYMWSFPTALLLVANLLFAGENSTYNMHASYGLTFLVLVQICHVVRTKRIVTCCIAIVECVIILLYGSRGAILCVMFFVAVLWLGNKKITRSRLIGILVLLGIVGILWLNIQKILWWVYQLLQSMGIYSRSIALLAMGMTLESDSRLELWKQTLEDIMSHPFLGMGILGQVQSSGITYPHNVFLELLVNWGIILGGLASIICIYWLLKVIFYYSGLRRDITVIFASAGFVPLLLSNTYSQQYYFMVFVFLMITAKNRKNYDAADRELDGLTREES